MKSGDLLKKIMAAHHITGRQLGEKLGHTDGAVVSKVASGERKISPQMIPRWVDALKRLRVSEIWTTQLASLVSTEARRELGIDVPADAVVSQPPAPTAAAEPEEVRLHGTPPSAGSALPVVGTIEDDVYLPSSTGRALILPLNCELVLVRGDSGGDAVRHGQLALVAPPERRPVDGDLVAVLLEKGEGFIGRYKRDRHGSAVLERVQNGKPRDILVLRPEHYASLRVVIGAVYELP